MIREFEFNRNPFVVGRTMEQPTQDVVKSTPSLWNASLDDALRYGGELTREAIGTLNLRGDRKHIIIDTKIHMLMPRMFPAIPSWHTDGVPRGAELNPSAKGDPNLFAQEELSDTRFHLLVTGGGCLTQFVKDPLTLRVPSTPSTKLYGMVNDQVRELTEAWGEDRIVTAPSCTAIEFDWFNLHRGVQATMHEWRFLIRVTETDHMEPQTNLRDIIRTQQQVYVPSSFSW